MRALFFVILLSFTSLQATSLQAISLQELIFSHVPMREDGKIAIPEHIKHVKLDIGLSYNAPMSNHWLIHEEDLWVFGFEPNPVANMAIKKGSVKRHPSHMEPIDPKHVGRDFFLIPYALGLNSGEWEKLYVTKEDVGCSSIFRPKKFEVDQIFYVLSYRLSDFFDLFPWDTHNVIEYIKIDAQGSDFNILKSAGTYLEERVVYVTLEPENDHYENVTNSAEEIDRYMWEKGFRRIFSKDTEDPTYFNSRFLNDPRVNEIKIFQKG